MPEIFFCNELFYRSLYRSREENNDGRKNRKLEMLNDQHTQAMPILFVHLPPIEIIPLKYQAHFVFQVIDEIVSSIES